MSKVKVTHPLRFLGFFGLFLVFIFLGIKSCQDNFKEQEFVDAEEISKEVPESLEKKNSSELAEFIQSTKEELEEKTKKEAALKKPNEDKIKKTEVKAVKKEPKKQESEKKEASATIEVKEKKAKVEKKKEIKAANEPSTIRLFGVNENLSKTSKILLAKTYIKKKSKISTITVYGYYFNGEDKAAGFNRAAKIKSELIKVGAGKYPIYIVPKLSQVPGLIGEVKM